jgi:hypothetical protein
VEQLLSLRLAWAHTDGTSNRSAASSPQNGRRTRRTKHCITSAADPACHMPSVYDCVDSAVASLCSCYVCCISPTCRLRAVRRAARQGSEPQAPCASAAQDACTHAGLAWLDGRCVCAAGRGSAVPAATAAAAICACTSAASKCLRAIRCWRYGREMDGAGALRHVRRCRDRSRCHG